MTRPLAVSTGCCTERPILEALAAAEEAGVGFVELGTPPRHFDPWDREQRAAVGQRLRDGHLHAVAIHAPFGGLLDLSDPNPHHRYAAIGAVLGAGEALRELGGRIVVVHTSDAERDPRSVSERLHCCAEALATLAKACREQDLTLAIESPLPHLVGGHPDEFAWILDRVDAGAGVCLDTGHAALGSHWRKLLAVAGHRLVHVHANDNNGRFDDHLAPGDGGLDWTGIVADLDAAVYRGCIVLELGCPGGPLAAHFARAREQAERLHLGQAAARSR